MDKQKILQDFDDFLNTYSNKSSYYFKTKNHKKLLNDLLETLSADNYSIDFDVKFIIKQSYNYNYISFFCQETNETYFARIACYFGLPNCNKNERFYLGINLNDNSTINLDIYTGCSILNEFVKQNKEQFFERIELDVNKFIETDLQKKYKKYISARISRVKKQKKENPKKALDQLAEFIHNNSLSFSNDELNVLIPILTNRYTDLLVLSRWVRSRKVLSKSLNEEIITKAHENSSVFDILD